MVTCTTILCWQIIGTKQALQDKKQPGRRTTVRKPAGVKHMKTGLERSTSFGRMTYCDTANVRRKLVQKFSKQT